jgi:hypothetical protein
MVNIPSAISAAVLSFFDAFISGVGYPFTFSDVCTWSASFRLIISSSTIRITFSVSGFFSVVGKVVAVVVTVVIVGGVVVVVVGIVVVEGYVGVGVVNGLSLHSGSVNKFKYKGFVRNNKICVLF